MEDVFNFTSRRRDAEHRAHHSKNAKKSHKHLGILKDKNTFLNNCANFSLWDF
jgi:hypothetical protein